MRRVRLGRYHNGKVRPKGVVAQYLRGSETTDVAHFDVR